MYAIIFILWNLSAMATKGDGDRGVVIIISFCGGYISLATAPLYIELDYHFCKIL